MNITQSKLFELMCKFDELCLKYGIIYYLGGGTALGAIRHHGFLPWDDDVDLYISRDNYKKLLDRKREFLDNDFEIVNHDYYPKYGNTVIRCVDINSTQITKARIIDDTPKGYFLELFILDPIPSDSMEQEKWKKKQWVYTEILSTAFKTANERNESSIDEELYLKYLTKVKTKGRENVIKELERELFEISEKDATQYCARWGVRNLLYDIDWFGTPRYISFENKKFPVAHYAENILRFDYGDNWMYIPSKDSQIQHTYVESTSIPYIYIVNDYVQTFDEEKVFNAYSNRKKILLEHYFSYRKAHKLRNKLKIAQVNASIEYNVKDISKIDELLLHKKFDYVEKIFDIWYKNQFSNSFWKWNMLLPIDDNIMSRALIPLLAKGKYSEIRQILLWRLNGGSPMPSKLKKIYEFVELLRKIYISIDNKEINLTYKYLQDIEQLNFNFKEDSINYQKLCIYFGVLSKKSDAEYIDLKKKCHTLLYKYPNDGELLFCMGKICEKIGNENFINWYKISLKNTNNGLVKLELERKLNMLEG